MSAYDAWRTGAPLVTLRRDAVRCYERPRLVESYGALMRQTAHDRSEALCHAGLSR